MVLYASHGSREARVTNPIWDDWIDWRKEEMQTVAAKCWSVTAYVIVEEVLKPWWLDECRKSLEQTKKPRQALPVARTTHRYRSWVVYLPMQKNPSISYYFLPPPPTTIASKYQDDENRISMALEVYRRDKNCKISALAREFTVPYHRLRRRA